MATNELVIMVMNTDYGDYEAGRKEIVKRFLNQEDLTPDFFLLQELKQEVKEKNREFENALFARNYSKIEVNEVQNSYNMIMFKSELQGTQKGLTEPGGRYCAGQFTFAGKKILLVSFHGNNELDKEDKKLKDDPRFEAIKGENGTKKIKAIKQFRLGEYLEEFQDLKDANHCDHLIVGGDFNLNVDKLLVPDEIRAQSPTLGQELLRERQEDFIELFNRLNLQIVPYNSQKRKYEALICDSGLSDEAITVKVYTKKEKKDEAGNILTMDGNTLLQHFPDFTQNTLNHDPLLFTIKIAAGPALVQAPPAGVPAEVQAPTAEELEALAERVEAINVNDQVPSTGVQHQAPAHANQVPTEEVQAATAVEIEALAEGVAAIDFGNKEIQENSTNQKPGDNNPTNQKPEASGHSSKGTATGARSKSSKKE
jgi:hypothetical protein